MAFLLGGLPLIGAIVIIGIAVWAVRGIVRYIRGLWRR